jgi:hypothetical protein
MEPSWHVTVARSEGIIDGAAEAVHPAPIF